MSSTPGPKCKINADWFAKKDKLGNIVSEWGTQVDATHVYCRICLVTLSCEKAGIQALWQHAATGKHKDNAKVKLSKSQLLLTSVRVPPAAAASGDLQAPAPGPSSTAPAPGNVSLALLSKKDEAVRAELIWVMECVWKTHSARSCVGVGDVFRAMCPQFHSEFSLSRTKFGYYLTEALGPHFRQVFLDDVQGYYTVCFDETVNDEGWKELKVALKYWSASMDEVKFHHLETFFIGHATAQELKSYIMQALRNASLSLSKMIMLSRDGPNVNKATFRLISDEVKAERGTALLDIGSCNLHIVHNSYEKGLGHLGGRVGEIAIAIHDFFAVWSGRWADYCQVQQKLNVPIHRFVKHVTSRWLSLSGAAERLQEQWPSLKEYFLKVIPKYEKKEREPLMNLKSCQRISEFLRDPVALPEISFALESAKIFEGFSSIFQKEEPMIHLLYEKMHSLVAVLLGRICKPETVLSLDDVNDPCLPEHLLTLAQVEAFLDAGTKLALKDIKDIHKLRFTKDVQSHFIASATHLMKKSVLNFPDTKYFKVLKPEERKNKSSVRWITKVARLLNLPDVSESRLRDEWVILQTEDINYTVDPKTFRIDHYWREIFSLKDTVDGSPKYPTITTVVKTSLVLAHGAADIERNFSTSGQILTEKTPRLSCKMLNAKLNVKAGMQRFQGMAHKVTITSGLMQSARFAYKKYADHLEREKREAEEAAKKQEEEEEEQRKLEEERKDRERSKKDLKKLEDEWSRDKKSAKESRRAADKLIETAETSLKQAVKRKNMDAVRVAQGMLEGAKKLREEAKAKEKDLEKKQEKLDKKKKGLISAYLQTT